MSSQSLFKISNELQLVINELIETGGELTPEIENALVIAEGDLKTKATNYAVVIRAIEYDNSIVDAEIKRLSAIKKVRINTVDRLKTALSNALIQFDIDEIETPTSKINFRKSTVLEVSDETHIDKKYKKNVVTTTIDKMAIKKDLKNGEKIAGCELVHKKNLQIK